MTQTEQIVWHKYPEEKPENDGEYLVQGISGHIRVYQYSVMKDRWFPTWSIIAWAELPKGWQEEVKSQNK